MKRCWEVLHKDYKANGLTWEVVKFSVPTIVKWIVKPEKSILSLILVPGKAK